MTAAAEMRNAVPAGDRNGADFSDIERDTAKHRDNSQMVPESGLSRKARVMEWADIYSRNGLNLVPVIPGRDRTPSMESFTKRGRALSAAVVAQKFEQCHVKHGGAQIGLVTGGLSRVVVVDVDNVSSDALSEAAAVFGNTPLIGKTPGGWHLFYQANGERTCQGLDVGGWHVDIRGEGGLAILPPSLHWRGDREYEWFRGSPDLLWSGGLPAMDQDALADLASIKPKATQPALAPVGDGEAVPVGRRNSALTATAGRLLRSGRCATLESLTAALLVFRDDRLDQSIEAVTDAEVEKVARSMWRGFDPAKAAKGQHYAKVSMGELDRAPRRKWGPLGLLAWLRMQHPTPRPGGFAISPEHVAELIGGGVTEKMVKDWRRNLTDWGVLALVRKGRGKGNPNGYEFPERLEHAPAQGTSEVRNILPVNPPPPLRDQQRRASVRLDGGGIPTAAGLAQRLQSARQALGCERTDFVGMVGAYLTARGLAWHGDTIAAIMDGRAARIDPALARGLDGVLSELGADDLREAS